MKKSPNHPSLEGLEDDRARLRLDGGPDDAALAELYGSLATRIDRERGLAAWLRSRRTASRVALGLGISAGLVLFAAAASFQAGFPKGRVAASVLALGLMLGVCVLVGLRPMHRASPRPWVEPGLVFGSLGALGALSILPLASHPLSLDPAEAAGSLKCLYGGVWLGIPAFFVLRALDRGGRPWSAALAGAAAGLAANAVLALRCPSDSAVHLLVGHASVGVLFVLGAAAIQMGVSRLRRRSPG